MTDPLLSRAERLLLLPVALEYRRIRRDATDREAFVAAATRVADRWLEFRLFYNRPDLYPAQQ